MPFQISQPSIQSLYIEMQANGNTIAIGTAFVATSASGTNFLLTNRHNVTGRHQETGKPLCEKTAAVPDSLVVWHNSSVGLGYYTKIKVLLIENEVPQWIEHPSLKETADFVALPINPCSDITLYPYNMGQFSHLCIEPSKMVSVVGFPFGERTGPNFAIWVTGFGASEPEINHGGRPVFLIDCRSRPGQSGSPVILYQNGGGLLTHENGTKVVSPVTQLLGIYSGRINKDSDLGVVWKSHAISQLLSYASAISNPI